MSFRTRLLACALLLCFTSVALADSVPWRRRRRVDVRINREAAERALPDDWPAEPTPPTDVDTARFAHAYQELCGFMPPGRRDTYPAYILDNARRFSVDPFLLAALTFRLGRCQPDAEGMDGVGLTLLSRRMYGDFVSQGAYHYYKREGSRWTPEELALPRFPFSEIRLGQAEPNLYFAAAILSVWKQQQHDVDAAFTQAPHRHYVSHFIWGDSVRSSRAEDRILTDRRRLLQYYGVVSMPPPIVYEGLALGAPLDGAPRVVSSYIGDERDLGARTHRGVDVEAVLGEPVRSVADGRVNFVGVDLPGHHAHESMDNEAAQAIPAYRFGAGGRYVCVLHHPPAGGYLRSCYMHLDTMTVRAGQEVHRGDQIGTVGRTGMRVSSPHLHLEFHAPDELLDASVVLNGMLIGHRPPPPRRHHR